MEIGKLGKILILLHNDHFQCYCLENFREHVYYPYISAVVCLLYKFVKNIAPLQKKDKKVTLLQFYLLSAE